MLGTITDFCGEYDKFTNIGKNLNFFLGLQQFIYQVSSIKSIFLCSKRGQQNDGGK
jgi:hypothetical protein